MCPRRRPPGGLRHSILAGGPPRDRSRALLMKHTELESTLQASPHRQALIKHRFFEDFSRTLSREQVAVVLGQWWHPLHYFPEFLAKLLAVVPTVEMKTAVSRILHEELGEGESD